MSREKLFLHWWDQSQRYESSFGHIVQREYGKTPNGNDLNGCWVLRDNGILVDYDQYRIDLAERRGLELGQANDN